MPYRAEEREGKWVVVNSETGEVKAIHENPDAEVKAKKQVQLLEAIENDPNWEAKENG
jgi:uncharacterized protein (UPF0147 family)